MLVDDLGLVSGNRVLLRAPNNAMLVITWLAVAKAGGIVVATMPLLRRKELAEIVERAEIRLALCDDRLLDELDGPVRAGSSRSASSRERAAAEGRRLRGATTPPPTTSCLIAFTSGTSGRPKGTMHFHRDVLAICDTFSREIVRPTRDDIFIGSPPLAFTFGLGGLVHVPVARRRRDACCSSAARPTMLLEAIERHGATICFTAPTAYRGMLALGVEGTLGEPAPLRLGRRDAAARHVARPGARRPASA